MKIQLKILPDISREIKTEGFPLSQTICVAQSWHLQLLLNGGGDDIDIIVLLLVGLAPTHHLGLVVVKDGAVRFSISVEIAPGSEKSNINFPSFSRFNGFSKL